MVSLRLFSVRYSRRKLSTLLVNRGNADVIARSALTFLLALNGTETGCNLLSNSMKLAVDRWNSGCFGWFETSAD